MELFILLAVARWFAGIARAAGRSPSAWGAAGAAAYLGGLFISGFVIGPLLSALTKGVTLVPAFAIYLAVINVAGLVWANSICLSQFDKNLTTVESFAHLSNIGAIVIASLFLIPPVIGLFVTGHLEAEEMVNAVPMAGLFLVAVVTLFELRKSRVNVDIVIWRAFFVLGANLILATVLLWYGASRLISLAGTISIIGAYLFCWLIVVVGLNVFCIGLTIRSSRHLKRRG